jgi:uncharacterized protein
MQDIPFRSRSYSLSGDDTPPAYHVMIKPRGPLCNLDCSYCFYLRKEALFDRDSRFRMSEEVLEEFTRQYIEQQRVPEVTFGWQGGEPTLMGLDFFRRAVEFQKKHRKPGMRVVNAFQTNGVLIDEEWCRFLRENAFLVGLSLDGPRELHDANRVDKGGKPTFEKVYQTLKLLQKHRVEYNILCVLNRANAAHPLPVYRFFKREGVEFIQFIPAVERKTFTPGPSPFLPAAREGEGGGSEGGVTEWTVRPEQFGAFLCEVFDEWARHDVGRIFVQHFDVALQAWAGQEPSLCVHARTCGNCAAIEHNGDLFSCDHYVTPENRLGNIMEMPMNRMLAAPFQRKFGQDKRDALPRQCRECPVLFACNGGCPKDRFASTDGGEPGLNYLCAGYMQFFTHVRPVMERMAALLREGRAPAEVMEELRRKERPFRAAGRNDLCPCGSGRKFKLCCLVRR